MNKFFTFAIIIVLGFFLGLFGREVIQNSSDERVERVIHLFEKLCLEPYLTGTNAVPRDYDLVFFPNIAPKPKWGDQQSLIFLEKSDPRSCKISTPPEIAFSLRQSKRLETRLTELVELHFPKLPRDKGIEGTALIAKGWLKGEIRSSERWGIYIWGNVTEDKKVHTFISFTKPNK
ncbi:MAG: hypothetical protein ACRBBO_07675 [Cognatishimia sp.]